MASLETAIELACSAHFGQRDKTGQPYILHPLRVMMAQKDETARVVAVLHDVVEDSAYGREELEHHGFGGQIWTAVDALTRRHGENYFDYVRRAKSDPIGRLVKIADIKDNLRPANDDEDAAGIARRIKYSAALEILEEAS